MWVGLELNILSFIPVISSLESELLIENSVKYFLVQRLASVMFIISSIISSLITGTISALIILAIYAKLGVVPFHAWFMNLIRIVSLKRLFLLSTLQKLGPLIILCSFDRNLRVLIFLSFTIIVSLRSGVRRISFNKILAASSLMNLVWIIIGGFKRGILLTLFFSIYSFLLLARITFFEAGGAEGLTRGGINDLWVRFMFLLSFLSLGGIPPLAGFIRKILILKECINSFSFIFIIFLTLRSVFILVFYLRYVFCTLSNIPNTALNPKATTFQLFLGAIVLIRLPLSLVLFTFNQSF